MTLNYVRVKLITRNNTLMNKEMNAKKLLSDNELNYIQTKI